MSANPRLGRPHHWQKLAWPLLRTNKAPLIERAALERGLRFLRADGKHMKDGSSFFGKFMALHLDLGPRERERERRRLQENQNELPTAGWLLTFFERSSRGGLF